MDQASERRARQFTLTYLFAPIIALLVLLCFYFFLQAREKSEVRDGLERAGYTVLSVGAIDNTAVLQMNGQQVRVFVHKVGENYFAYPACDVLPNGSQFKEQCNALPPTTP